MLALTKGGSIREFKHVCEWIKIFDMENEMCSNIWNVGISVTNFKEKQTTSYEIPFFQVFHYWCFIFRIYFKLDRCVMWMVEKGRSKLQISPLQRHGWVTKLNGLIGEPEWLEWPNCTLFPQCALVTSSFHWKICIEKNSCVILLPEWPWYHRFIHWLINVICISSSCVLWM